ncbi:hypothetical protein RchiOBHm_Chr5g0036171 [Rosa chinensis]|uniref:Uncharacterized protein n=1 Tax=Rosa chinensis TaxID=74649 RepID=A0A2P6QBF5_ROSCH|nr:hypothetical protein RchiOBHm_Chr5g0036171 [Rosa chinensis]
MGSKQRQVCKFEMELKSMMLQKMNGFAAAESSAPSTGNNQAKTTLRVFGGRVNHQPQRTTVDDERRRIEKAENLVHLICWGPN